MNLQLFQRLNELFDTHHIDEYTLVPQPNKFPDNQVKGELAEYFYVNGTKLAFSFACLTILSNFLAPEFSQWKLSRKSEFNINHLTRALVMCNSENRSAWTVRKGLIESGEVSPQEELSLASIVASKYPKSDMLWDHRSSVLKKMVLSAQGSQDLLELFQAEVRLCEDAGTKYRRNYYVWKYRQTVFEFFNPKDPRVLPFELEKTFNWMYRNVSDYSGLCHRQRVLLCEAQLSQEPIKIWERELTENLRMMELFPGHESIWSFRRFLIFEWLKCVPVSQSLSIDAEVELAFKSLDTPKDQTYALTYFCWLVENATKQCLEPTLLQRFATRFDEILVSHSTPVAVRLRQKFEINQKLFLEKSNK